MYTTRILTYRVHFRLKSSGTLNLRAGKRMFINLTFEFHLLPHNVFDMSAVKQTTEWPYLSEVKIVRLLQFKWLYLGLQLCFAGHCEMHTQWFNTAWFIFRCGSALTLQRVVSLLLKNRAIHLVRNSLQEENHSSIWEIHKPIIFNSIKYIKKKLFRINAHFKF